MRGERTIADGSLIAIGDLDGDRKLELAIAAGDQIELARGAELRSFDRLRAPEAVTAIAIADVLFSLATLNGAEDAILDLATKKLESAGALLRCDPPAR